MNDHDKSKGSQIHPAVEAGLFFFKNSGLFTLGTAFLTVGSCGSSCESLVKDKARYADCMNDANGISLQDVRPWGDSVAAFFGARTDPLSSYEPQRQIAMREARTECQDIKNLGSLQTQFFTAATLLLTGACLISAGTYKIKSMVKDASRNRSPD